MPRLAGTTFAHLLHRITQRGLVALALAFSQPVTAKEISTVVTYPVQGRTAGEIYEYIRQHAPKVVPNATFAFTVIATKTASREVEAGSSCHYAQFKTSAYYAFYLPRLARQHALPPATRAKWREFEAYLKHHEQGHRALWRECLADYDSRSRALSGRSCPALDAARERLFTRIKRACLQKDEAFDFAFRKDVRRQPFVLEATVAR